MEMQKDKEAHMSINVENVEQNKRQQRHVSLLLDELIHHLSADGNKTPLLICLQFVATIRKLGLTLIGVEPKLKNILTLSSSDNRHTVKNGTVQGCSFCVW
jgi:hypothetical protein